MSEYYNRPRNDNDGPKNRKSTAELTCSAHRRHRNFLRPIRRGFPLRIERIFFSDGALRLRYLVGRERVVCEATGMNARTRNLSVCVVTIKPTVCRYVPSDFSYNFVKVSYLLLHCVLHSLYFFFFVGKNNI